MGVERSSIFIYIYIKTVSESGHFFFFFLMINTLFYSNGKSFDDKPEVCTQRAQMVEIHWLSIAGESRLIDLFFARRNLLILCCCFFFFLLEQGFLNFLAKGPQ